MKKIFSLLWGVSVLALSTISCTFAYTQEQREAYEWAYKYGITTQATVEAAKLDWNITRQAFAKMVVNYLENYVKITWYSRGNCNFPDESKITSDLRIYARKTCSYNIMWKNWTKFNPTQPLDKAQLWTVLSRILWWEEYNATWKWYYIYHLNALKFNWIMDNIDNPTSYVKRWDVFVMLKKIGDKFGSNIYMNGWDASAAYDSTVVSNNTTVSESDDYFFSDLVVNGNVIYTWKDWTKFVYDDNFLNVLMNTAKEKWEDDLYKFLEIEASYYKDGLDEFANIDLDGLAESLGIDDDIDPDTLSAKEKEELLKKVKKWMDKLIKENKDRNDEYINKLEKVTKNVSSSDKFWLKEKYKKTKWFIDATVSFLDVYSEILYNLLELSFSSEDWEIDDWEGMAVAFWLIWAGLAYQSETQDYQTYIEEWAVNAVKLLWGVLNTDNVEFTNRSFDDLKSRESNAQRRARDVARKNDLSQVQTAIVTYQQDEWVWPGMDKWATKGIWISKIEKELMYAWMASIPTDPLKDNKVTWLWDGWTTEYQYLVAKRYWTSNGWFILMAKTENEWWSNWVVCENKSWLENWYITNDTDLRYVTPCSDVKEGNSCSAKACTYTNKDQLRYILIY